MVPLRWSGGSQFSSTVLPVGVPIMVSIRGGEGAVEIYINSMMKVHGVKLSETPLGGAEGAHCYTHLTLS